ncbi:peptide chain release factor N(5)-glutamine methyltransferase [Fluoribacter gormanii]|uniref:Release factor glutamine methyltransferase n=1 Tax=Fluoribacter gormanii TaxID=464 RepID=A0A377GGY3_9GAMM|nr:peptide chain release factor N(5)-glutamine methyltransferase [Fluoribacter gormanii]KTD02796.1 methyltransferase HemK [Fluoribacter gormanii]SIR58270.1 [protein release factor]-glutamine N5-methyltransferase [Fluoribacter gormanii]STO23813.1 Release factor glutamine methyltransferase [Fluoribacter gormanii]
MISIRTALGKTPDLETEILLCHALKRTRTYLFAHPEELLSSEQWEHFQSLMAQRAQGIPIAYIIGEREFWSLNLKVNRHTLIPRHETERLVELALELIPNRPDTYVLDLGTGSGAIALALANERPHWHIVAADISQEALKIAKENAQSHKIRNVSFYLSNWFSNLPRRQYHALVANPPYISEHDPHLQQGDLRFEPQNALVSSQEGLADLQCIIKQGYDYLLPDGLILLEHGYDQKLEVQTILNELQYKNVQCWHDIQGNDRVSGGWR